MLANESIDAVDICTWNCGHTPVAIAAANAGKHVFCEKPLADSLENALAVKAAVEKAGVRFLLGVPAGSILPMPWLVNCWTKENWVRSTMPKPPICGGEVLPPDGLLTNALPAADRSWILGYIASTLPGI